ncbi:MAG TPA: phosphate acyltransferase PlsX [bacterium]|nr:phosphate acyltransferase PlsX [bacterium]HQL62717.1 phosphate acyltransferase PlsX [bacterium]
MPIIIDAMGGDRAPADVLEGVRLFREEDPLTELILVGRQEELQSAAERLGCEVVHAPTVVGMHDSPSSAVKSKRDSSIGIAMRLAKEGRGDIVISMGNSGAATAFAFFVLGCMPGVSRPCISTLMPTIQNRHCLLADVGATVDCKPQHLLEWAALQSVYMREVMGRESPTVGLLSIGEENTKGNELVFAAGPLLASSGLNYIGHVEGVDIPSGKVDVIVCDGFVGNVVLKFGEGLADMILSMFRDFLQNPPEGVSNGNTKTRLVNEFVAQCDYSTYGAAQLLGINGLVLIGHGRSAPRTFASAIRTARKTISHGDLLNSMRRELEQVFSAVAVR